MSNESTPRMQLPLLQSGQTQKEITHNEALARLDLLVQPAIETVADAPPADPQPGQCWIVGQSPTGDWIGRVGQVAGWTAGGWRYVAPHEGMAVWLTGDRVEARYDQEAWRFGMVRVDRIVVGDNTVLGAQQPAIADPVGGGIVDGEARSTLAALLAMLRAHGLIAA